MSPLPFSPLPLCDGILIRFLPCSVSPGPVTLATLMDPDSYTVDPDTPKPNVNREQELAKYDLFPMYPTGTYYFPHYFL